MHYKRAIWRGVLAYLIFSVLGIISIKHLNFEINTGLFSFPEAWETSMVILIIIITFMTVNYFSQKDVKTNSLEGLLLGLVFIISGTIIELMILIPYQIFTDRTINILEYYSGSLYFVSIGILLFLTTLIGTVMQQTKKNII